MAGSPLAIAYEWCANINSHLIDEDRELDPRCLGMLTDLSSCGRLLLSSTLRALRLAPNLKNV